MEASNSDSLKLASTLVPFPVKKEDHWVVSAPKYLNILEGDREEYREKTLSDALTVRAVMILTIYYELRGETPDDAFSKVTQFIREGINLETILYESEVFM